MFEENKNLVNETENTEQTVEEIVEEVIDGTEPTEQSDVGNVTEQPAIETFTREQVNDMMAKRTSRIENKLRREYESKYGRLETVVNTGLGTNSIEESTSKLEEFYKQKGIDIPDTPRYSEREEEILANSDAEEVISDGYEYVKAEVERLAGIGVENMTKRDKLYFSKLANYRKEAEQENELRSLGISKDEINNKDFQDFAKKLNHDLSLKEKYDMYSQIKPKKEFKKIGSVKNPTVNNNGVKDFYTFEEASKFTRADFDKDPALFKAVCDSMTKWK